MRGMFGPSFLSGYRTATTMVRMVKEIYEENPVLVVRIWPIWAHCLVALVMLGAVAQTPACSLAKQALADFDSTLELFSSAHEHPVVKVGLVSLFCFIFITHFRSLRCSVCIARPFKDATECV